MTRASVWYEIGTFFGRVAEHRESLLAAAQQERAKSQVLVMVGGGAAAARAEPAIVDPGVDLVMVRADLRGRLQGLEATLGMLLSERDKYFALFPIVIYVDEVLRSATGGSSNAWESLQSEFYGLDNGGERFYSVLDELMVRGEIHPIVLEIFYYCLNDGFEGQYAGEPSGALTIASIKERLASKIPVEAVSPPSARSTSSQVDIVPFPWTYYAIVIASIVGMHMLLRIIAFADGGMH